jgi:hypothetical protein
VASGHPASHPGVTTPGLPDPAGGGRLTGEPNPNANSDLKVAFSREGEDELIQIVPNGDKTHKAAMVILAQQDAPRASDNLTFKWHARPGLIERGLAWSPPMTAPDRS